MSKAQFVGQAIARKEDRWLTTGRGRFVSDIRLPRMAHVAFARSAMAHARIRAVDISRARALEGVIAIYLGKDLSADLGRVPGMQNRPPDAWRKSVEHELQIPDQPLIADEILRYVGEPYAIVVAENRYIAEDAIEQIEPDLETLPIVTDPFEAMRPEAPLLHAQLSGNVVARFHVRKGEVPSGKFRRIRRRFINHRFLASPIECRGVVAEYDERTDSITIWSATQVVHWVRREVAKQLRLPEGRVRCIAPDVGGGFGVKGHVYPEEVIVPYLARLLRRPVTWIEDRQEHLLNSSHSRDDVHDAEITFDEDGRIIGLKDDFVKDSGAFTPSGIGALANTVAHICGPYDIPNLDMTSLCVVTNKTPNSPYRGNGRPEASFVIERLIDLMANDLNLDPIEVRLRNMIPGERMPYRVGVPYRDGKPIVYDSGNFPLAFNTAIDALGGLAGFRAKQRCAWQHGRYIGLGVASYVEGTGVGPFEGATIRIDPSGSIVVATGACSSGQGHETVFAQVAADEWQVTPDDVTVLISDTAAIDRGYGSIASRSAVTSSAAIRKASAVLRKKVFAIAAYLLECDAGDLELINGTVAVKGVSGRNVSLRDIAKVAQPGWDSGRPPKMAGGLEVTEYFEPETVTWSYGTHAGIIEIDADTGALRIQKYVVAHDAGVLLNPLIADGQVMGGVCQGIGGVMMEKVVHDAQGQNLMGSLVDYLLPVAVQMPELEILHFTTPSPLNELGVKGLGEGGVVGAPAVILNGVCDALRPIGFEANQSFYDQAAVVAAIARARAPS